MLVMRQAVRERRVVTASIAGTRVVLWPYALGWREGAPFVRALVLRLAGRGQCVGDEEWVRVNDLCAPALREAAWIPPGAGSDVALAFFDRVEAMGPAYRSRAVR